MIILFPDTSYAQVTIGSNVKAKAGSLLDLKETDGINQNAKGGLLLPRVKLQTLNTLAPQGGAYTEKDIHIGLMVYNMTNNNNDICEGPYVWEGDKWKRLWLPCPCEYKVKGWNDNLDYYVLCQEFKNVTQNAALNVCKSAVNGNTNNLYHLMTDKEFEQIWSEPVDGTTASVFNSDENYFLQKKSEVATPYGWTTMGTVSDESSGKVRDIIALDRAQYHTSPSNAYFPGGTPIGGVYSTGTVRCVRN